MNTSKADAKAAWHTRESWKSGRCDRIRAAVIALEAWDEARELCVEPVDEFAMNTWRCNTAACAAGYLALLPAFNAQGLRLNVSGLIVVDDAQFDDSVGLLGLFFDVERHVVSSWFMPYHYLDDAPRRFVSQIVPSDVARRMRAYLRHHGEETGTVAPRKRDRRPNFLTRALAKAGAR